MNVKNRQNLRWLTGRLAAALDVPASALNPMVPLADMGVDSVQAVSLVGEIEMHFDLDVDPTLIFDYPTLAHIAEYLTEALAEQTVEQAEVA
ncbi:acyl carrier protein [Mycobacterium asiaticum]|uniref:Acyl carrier protein n=1 Tax=Mycobacterium asiaticum TaxID=1790 RepID=A0A1A3NNE3_MYCAS|nr:acyl carrier protein [Mycobacterium asiaticum]OBK23658.1 acyl carrier protein [Mycobacterium asiaticum]